MELTIVFVSDQIGDDKSKSRIALFCLLCAISLIKLSPILLYNIVYNNIEHENICVYYFLVYEHVLLITKSLQLSSTKLYPS